MSLSLKTINKPIKFILECCKAKLYNGEKCHCKVNITKFEEQINNNDSTLKIKENNEINAKILEKQIVDYINNNKGIGNKIKDAFEIIFNKKIINAIRIGEKKHHDIKFICNDNSIINCEVKSSKNFNPNKWKTPWQYAVQFLNGTGKEWRIREYYGREWYKGLPKIKEDYNLKNDIPSFEEWWKNDASIGSVKTNFGKEFKSTVSSEERKKIKKNFVKDLIVSDEEVNNLLEDYLRESKKVLEEKDCWLIVSDKCDDIKMFDKILPENINEIKRKNDSVDLVYKIKSSIFNEIRIRWQNDNCIANISVQCK